MKTFDEVTRIWAARKLKMPVERIVEVSFDADEGYHYSSWTYADAYARATVTVTGYSRSPKTRYKDFDLLEDFANTLNELVAIAQEND